MFERKPLPEPPALGRALARAPFSIPLLPPIALRHRARSACVFPGCLNLRLRTATQHTRVFPRGRRPRLKSRSFCSPPGLSGPEQRPAASTGGALPEPTAFPTRPHSVAEGFPTGGSQVQRTSRRRGGSVLNDPTANPDPAAISSSAYAGRLRPPAALRRRPPATALLMAAACGGGRQRWQRGCRVAAALASAAACGGRLRPPAAAAAACGRRAAHPGGEAACGRLRPPVEAAACHRRSSTRSLRSSSKLRSVREGVLFLVADAPHGGRSRSTHEASAKAIYFSSLTLLTAAHSLAFASVQNRNLSIST